MDFKDIILESAECNNLMPRYNYSGRCMYGESCFGLVGNMNQIAGFLIDVTQACVEHDADFQTEYVKTELRKLRDFRSDSMGLDIIMYFPRLQIDCDEDCSDDFDEDDDMDDSGGTL